MMRLVLLLFVPLAVIAIAVLIYLSTGRYVSTDNAYLKSHIVSLSVEVPGPISEVLVEENQRVGAGEVLFRLDDQPYRVELERAEAMLAEVETTIESDRLAYQRALSEIELFESTAEYAATQMARQQGLTKAELGRQEDLDTARYEMTSAQRRVGIARQNAQTLLAKLKGDPEIPVTSHPAWLAARADRDAALLDLERTVIKAPFPGVITNRPEPGDYVAPGTLVVSIVADQNMWVEANFKETQMTHIRVGQPVEFEVDAYPGTTWHGQVESISRSTGAEFALLPPQNATGNWVKIVQRVPVRIAITDDHPEYELRTGMSCATIIDTGHKRQWHELLPGG